ncbi:hypothetical protein Scep_023928 [Stephania cephalantha]|uniref:Uncharacterized protein n=1 Tax=Stephania cephalantha TaxID=152367 RepID=A0AAP0HT82_9MAGN
MGSVQPSHADPPSPNAVQSPLDRPRPLDGPLPRIMGARLPSSGAQWIVGAPSAPGDLGGLESTTPSCLKVVQSW